MPLVSELASYLDSDTVTCFDDYFDIIIWWHEHKLTYPILSILAKDVMSVPVSTVVRITGVSDPRGGGGEQGR